MAYLSELERCVKHQGIPQELDSKAMFLIHEEQTQPHVVFVDLETGDYRTGDKDIIPDDFCIIMNYLLGSKVTQGNNEAIFPKPVTQFFEGIQRETIKSRYIRMTKIRELLDQLNEEMRDDSTN